MFLKAAAQLTEAEPTFFSHSVRTRGRKEEERAEEEEEEEEEEDCRESFQRFERRTEAGVCLQLPLKSVQSRSFQLPAGLRPDCT